MKRVCLYCVLLWAAVACAPGDNKYSERDFVGIWVEPVPGMVGVQGIALEEDGAAHSVNMATLRYETWKYEKGSVEPVIHGDRKSQWAENSQYDKEKRADGVDD